MKQKFFLLLLFKLLSSCTHLFYYPDNKKHLEPEKLSFSYQEYWFESLDGTKLHAWYFPPQGKINQNITVVQFHGNAQNLSSHFISLAWLAKEGFGLFVFDYRGYGLSEGKPYPLGLRKDSLAALKFARDNISNKLVVWGQSLGGVVALDALSRDKSLHESINAIIIESSFLSYQKIARKKLASHWISWPFQPLSYILISDKTSPKSALISLKDLPTLVMHAESDPVVPYELGRELFIKLKTENKQFLAVPGHAHGNIMLIEAGLYRPEAINFILKTKKE